MKIRPNQELKNKLGAVEDLMFSDLSFKEISKKWDVKINYLYQMNQCNFKWMVDFGFTAPLRKTAHQTTKEVEELICEGKSKEEIMDLIDIDEKKYNIILNRLYYK